MKTLNLLEAGTPAAENPVVTSRGRRRSESKAGKVRHAATKFLKFFGRMVSALLLAATVAVFLFLAVGPRFLEYQTSTMLTASMSPGINPGDVVVSAKIPVAELRVGDIITYSIPIDDRRVETHRVISIEAIPGGQTSVRTKGDANASVDPWTAILSEEYVYKNVAVVPYLGTGIRALRQPPVQAALLYGAPAVVVLILLKSIWSKPKSKPDADAGDVEASESAEREVQQ